MNDSHTVTIPIRAHLERQLVYTGEKIKLSKDSFIRKTKRVKTKEMVFRLKRKTFHPTFIVTSTNNHIPGQLSFIISPYNF